MAVTSIWPIKAGKRSVASAVKVLVNYAMNPEKVTETISPEVSALHTIENVVQYAANDLKTETRSYVTCIGCQSEETAAQEFMEVKQYFGKTEGRVCFHGYQSFKAGEVDAETAHKIGVELAQKMWGEDFQVVIATHCNTGCYHNHFVLNSVAWTDGHHYDNRPSEYRYFRELSDWLCQKYRLSVIENPSGHGRQYGEYRAEKNGGVGVRASIRKDIDAAIAVSVTQAEFFRHLQSLGYELKLYKQNGDWLEYPALRPPGAKGFFRFHKLGEGYDLPSIGKRIWEDPERKEPFPEEEQEKLAHYRKETQPIYHKHVTGLKGLYIRYCYELRIIQKHQGSVKRVSQFLREDLSRLGKLDTQTRLLGRENISTAQELFLFQDKLKKDISELSARRKELRNDLRNRNRHGDTESAESVRSEITEITRELRQLRKEVSLCDEIEARSQLVRQELESLIEQQERTEEKTNQKEAKQHELFVR